MDPKGSTILVGFEDGVVRVLNFHEKDEIDVHGRKVKDCTELALKQAFKPHNGKVTVMAIDSRAEVLATGVSGIALLDTSSYYTLHFQYMTIIFYFKDKT